MPFANWWQGLQRRLSRRTPELRLGHRNLYILPSGFGGLWLLTAAVLYLLGINSRTNSPVLLAFLMAALMLLSLFLTHLNLQGLGLREVPQQGPFLAGEQSSYWIETSSRCHRPSLKWRWLAADAPPQQCLELKPGSHRLALPWLPPRRGYVHPGRLLIHTTAPLGLYRCWCYWEPPSAVWVAPTRRAGPVEQLQPNTPPGDALFDELRPWRPEEGFRRVDWKARARGRGWLAKSFVAETHQEIWLTPARHLPLEAALEHLCDRLWRDLDAGLAVGLVLPNGSSLSPRNGRAQLERCLQALAEWPPCP